MSTLGKILERPSKVGLDPQRTAPSGGDTAWGRGTEASGSISGASLKRVGTGGGWPSQGEEGKQSSAHVRGSYRQLWYENLSHEEVARRESNAGMRNNESKPPSFSEKPKFWKGASY